MLILHAFREASVFVKFILLLFFMVVSCCLCMFVAAIISFITVGGDLNAFQQLFSLHASVSFLKLFQAAQAIGLFLIPPFIVAFLLEKEGVAFLKMKQVVLSPISISIALVFFLFPLINWLGGINQLMHLPPFLSGIEQWMRQAENQASDLTQKFLFADGFSVLLINVFIMALLPALGEEFLFRGVIQQYLLKIAGNKHIAVWVTAIIFSAFHLQFFGFFPRMVLGAVLGYLFIWSENIWYPIVFHFVNNALAVAAYYLFQTKIISTNPETLATNPSDVWMIFATVPFIFLLLWRFSKMFDLIRNN